MSNKEMTKDLATLAGANLLASYLNGVKAQLAIVTDEKNQPALKQDTKDLLREQLGVLRKLLGHLSGERKSRKILVRAIEKLRDQLDEKYEYVPLTITRVRNLEKAIDFAISSSFGLKEDIQNASLVAILEKTSVLESKHLVPESYMKLLEKIEQDND
jgi:hypothetical protein